MKKKLLVILLVIAVIIIAPIIAFRIYCSLPIYDEHTIEEFSPYREDFEIVNNYILETFSGVSDAKMLVILHPKTGEFHHLSSNGKTFYADEKVAAAFTRMNESFWGYTLYSITISPNRINYEAFSEIVLTYTKNGKKPKYFYHRGDGVNFNTYPLWDNWYYLHLSVF